LFPRKRGKEKKKKKRKDIRAFVPAAIETVSPLCDADVLPSHPEKKKREKKKKKKKRKKKGRGDRKKTTRRRQREIKQLLHRVCSHLST